MISDPSQLLERIPELEALCAHASIKRAVESGDPFKVYRALFWARLFNRLPRHRDALKSLLAHRRLFARPLKGNPWLGTVNSLGMSFVGKFEQESDGTWIANHCLVIGFVIPLLPFGSYVVLQEGAQGLSTSWRIFARVPMGTFNWLWSRTAALAVVLLIAAGVNESIRSARYHPVHVVSDFAQPVQVEIGSVKATVAPHSRAALDVPVGKHQAVARLADGTELERVSLEARSGRHLQVWNVAGAAVVFQEKVGYFSVRAEERTRPQPIHFCGKSVMELGRVEDAFTAPPRTVTMSQDEQEVWRTHVDVQRDAAQAPMGLCLLVLSSESRFADLLPLLELEARLSGWDEGATAHLAWVASLTGGEQARAVAGRLRAVAPATLTLSRHYQNIRLSLGEHAALLAEFKQAAEASPDSADAQWLSLRLQGPQVVAAQLDGLLKRFPKHRDLRCAAVGLLNARGDFAQATTVWKQLYEEEPRWAAAWVLDEAVTSLVAQKQTGAALALLEGALDQLPPGTVDEAVELYSRVAALEGKQVPAALLARVETQGPNLILRQRAGLPVELKPDGQVPNSLKALQLLEKDPDQALALCANLGPFEARALGRGTWALAYGEAVRTGNQAAATALIRVPFVQGPGRQAFEAYVKGEQASVEHQDLVVRAAAELIRSRNAHLPEKERALLVVKAKQDDVLHTSITQAVAQWKPGAAR